MEFEEFVRAGPGTLAGRYLRMFWQPVCCSHDLMRGRALPIRILGEDFTIYRGKAAFPILWGRVVRIGERNSLSVRGVFLLRKIWERELRKWVEGRPLKQWTYRPEMVSTYPRA